VHSLDRELDITGVDRAADQALGGFDGARDWSRRRRRRVGRGRCGAVRMALLWGKVDVLIENMSQLNHLQHPPPSDSAMSQESEDHGAVGGVLSRRVTIVYEGLSPRAAFTVRHDAPKSNSRYTNGAVA
jgi:hypothetical protein